MNKDSAYDYFRKQERTISTKSIENMPVLLAVTQHFVSESESDLFQEFWKQFSELNLLLIDRQIFWLAERNDFTIMEIAERTGIPKSTANDKLRIVKQKCLDYLIEKFEARTRLEEPQTTHDQYHE